MKQKYFKYQLIAIYSLTLINLLYFVLKDLLTDNLFQVSTASENVSYISYYFSSLLAVIGYFSGTWIIAGAIVYTIFYKFIFSKREKSFDQYSAVLILGGILGFSSLIFPLSVGEGLKFYLNGLLHPFILALLSFALFAGFLIGSFDGSLKKMNAFFKTLNQEVINWYRKYQYNNQGKKRVQAIASAGVTPGFSFKMLVKDLMRGKKTAVAEIVEQKIKTFKETIVPVKTPVKEVAPIKQENREEASEELEENIENEIETDEVDDIQNFDEEQNEEQQEEDEIIEVESPFKKFSSTESDNKAVILNKKKNEVEFFKSGDLIDCITRNSANTKQHNPDKEYFEQIIESIEEKFSDFRISAKIINILKGPVVDTFEVELGPGVKVSKIQGIQKDLTLALKGAPVRIVSNMKGKSTMGLEVPRSPREIIYLDEVLRSREFNESTLRLPIAMGKDAYGEPCVVDLAKMPHMLVAGATGAGKSVFINTMLVSLLIKMPPEKMKLILVDPKQLELALYQNLPHLMLPVTTESSEAGAYLLWACQEMERRYSILSDFGVRNIEGFNKKVADASDQDLMRIHKYYEGFEDDGYELPYIVIVVDEFADLILTKDGKAIENSICRLAAKARAAGIHLVIATQRPSVDVITGLIKANFPTRVSFRVTSQIDSRTILNTMGAEMLLGMGDMLYKHGIDMVRLHSAYVDEDEIEQLVEKLGDIPFAYNQSALDFVKNNGITESEDGSVSGINSGSNLASNDDKYDEAVQIAIETRKISASYLQRRLGIGYNRAARIIELMEERGIVGPQQGSKPRKVLVGSV